jgi:hypothetical protein
MKKSNRKKLKTENIGGIVIDSAINFMMGYKEGNFGLMSLCLFNDPGLVNYLSNKTSSEVYRDLLVQDNKLSESFYKAVNNHGRLEQYNGIVSVYNTYIGNCYDSRTAKRMKVIKKK